jgi:hypothetical protein
MIRTLALQFIRTQWHRYVAMGQTTEREQRAYNDAQDEGYAEVIADLGC